MKKHGFAPTAFVQSALFLCGGLLFSLALASCKKTDSATAEAQVRERIARAEQNAIADYVRSLSDEQKICQLFLVNVAGDTEFFPVEKTGALYGNADEGDPLVPGGCLLFSYNIADTPEKIAAYTASIRQFYADHGMVPPYVAIDQEGGYVNRLRGITSNVVSQKKVTEWFTPQRAHDLYAAQARQLAQLGIQMNLAPVVEVETPENAAFLDTRSFGSLDQVLVYAKAEIAAYEENGIATVLKHFPGNNNTDPHTGLPQIALSAAELETYLAPFEALAPFSSALLMSHAIARVSDANGNVVESTQIPACFSPYWVGRARAAAGNEDALLFSDDIFMGALADNGYPPERAVVGAIDAGITCIMLSEKQFGEVAGVLLTAYKQSLADADKKNAGAFAQKVETAVRHVIAYKIRAGLLQYVPVLNKNGEADKKHPAYIVAPNLAAPAFDQAAYTAAYDEGMRFYQ